MSKKHVKSRPYLWPWNGDLRPDNTVLIVIDMQTDFCGVGGYVDKMGYDLSLTRAPIEPIKRLLTAMRGKGFHIFHTREGHRPDVADPPAASAPASAIRGRAAASWCVARGAGTSSLIWRRPPASRSSTSPARAR